MGAAPLDRIRAEAQRLLAAGVSGQVFPGAVAGVSWRTAEGALEWAEAAAGLTEPGGKAVGVDTPFDLASITKSLVGTIALRLVDAGVLGLDLSVDRVLGELRGSIGGSATLEALLTHRSGLAAWGGLYLDVPHEVGSNAARRWIVGEAARRPDDDGGGPERAVYSDLGYIIAGETIAKRAGQDLSVLLAEQIVKPLGIADDQLLYPARLSAERKAEFAKRCAATERDDWRGYLVRGEVHDENCAALGGVSGHAGTFGTARAVCQFGRGILEALGGRSNFVSQAALEHALKPRPGGTYQLGWELKSPERSASGKRMSDRAFGHLGFTGTSIWCDPVRDIVVVLLTNRVCPSRANQKIKGFRPAFHDGILAVLESFA